MNNVQRLELLASRCEHARDAAKDPRFKNIWQKHAFSLRLRQKLIETMH